MEKVLNYNEQIRKKIVDDIENIIINKGLKIEDALVEYENCLYNMSNNDSKKIYCNYLYRY